ncbi:1-acyl-sn-glycerol-3-phosphate acyltransferase [Sulfurovum sp. XGS-02]|uniref:lysophospholipid acyltransferase family protein n=1 Tax=Sulfurovum sp. XGS-02 TaxID=2925411 RepID=UPI00205923AA|nr:lysophospholipid acyltransferase family protein [Sulfurovum sp. XGS-02]UPT78058.1 1-acyl-sn-glycerol-3-phosphate acyltransferase [Sulfurovum sp. XGS-02]
MEWVDGLKLIGILFNSFGYNFGIYEGNPVTFNTIKQLFYGLYLTNSFGYRLSKVNDPMDIKRLRLAYSEAQLDALHISVKVENPEKLPQEGQYLLVANHRSIIDPPLIEIALKDTKIFGPWISKKELYNSFFFGLFVRNAGSILLDREKSQMSGFFAEIKEAVKRGESIFIFPEGTRNKTDKALTTFKEGSRIIALKNRLPILPVYIKTNADKALKNALNDSKLAQDVTVVIGDVIDYKEKTSLEITYRKMFDLEEESNPS